jgi:aminoglycoside phosphotransferase (APT) family kinase protein
MSMPPPAEIAVDVPRVRRLLGEQCPALARKSIELAGEGWDNFTFRVGREHAVRLPRREPAVDLLRNEQRWLPPLATRLPVAVPALRHAGSPGEGFPWPWSLVDWLPGQTAESHRFGDADSELLARTLRALHAPAPDEAPVNPFRGVPLEATAGGVERRLARLRSHACVDTGRLAAIWRQGVEAPRALERRWMHGDLHPRNVIVRDGLVAGLIDWGDLNGGDVATDLACAWTLIAEPAVRRRFLDDYGASQADELRARGWAVHLGLALAGSREPHHEPLGLAALDRVTGED